MELETMFTEQKWNILKCLSEDKFSPLQLAEKLNTTMANISQQLRLLEAVNLVKKEKIRNRDKGKPRSLFSLTEDYAYLISTMHGFANKKLLKATEHHKIILKIWFLESSELNYGLERIYWKTEPYFKQIDAIAVNEKLKEIIIISDKEKEIKKAIGQNEAISIKIIPKEDCVKLVKQHKEPFSLISGLSIIYDPNSILKGDGGGSEANLHK